MIRVVLLLFVLGIVLGLGIVYLPGAAKYYHTHIEAYEIRSAAQEAPEIKQLPGVLDKDLLWTGNEEDRFIQYWGPSAARYAKKVAKIFLAPGTVIVAGIGNAIPGQVSNSSFMPREGPGYLLLLFALVVFCWVFWSFTIPRSLKLVGLWNPFLTAESKGRPWLLKALVAFSEWSEIRFRFGQAATGGWAGLLEILSNRYKAGDIFLGRPRLMLRPIGISTEKHMVTIAAPGSGKTTGGIIPNLCLHRGSLLCIDPVGELAALTAGRRNDGGKGVWGLGQRVHVVDPFNLEILKEWRDQSSSYNVFDELARVAEADPAKPVRYAGKIADAMVEYSTGENRYFDQAAHTFLRGLILYIFSYEPPERRNLVRMRELLMQGDVELYRDQVKRKIIDPDDKDTTPFDVLLANMKVCEGGPYDGLISGAASSIMLMGDRQMGAVVTTAQEHTAFLDSPEIQRISLKSDFLLEDLKDQRTSIYICVPLNAVTGKEGRWLRMFVLLTIDMMSQVVKAPSPPLLLAIDEFPSLGFLEGIESVGPNMRKNGVRLWVIGQDIDQFKAVYPKSWKSFIGNAEAVQFMGITHPETVKYIVEDLIGKHVVKKRRREGRGWREVEEERPVRDAEQIGRILSKEHKTQIIWRGSKRPMLLKITPYFEYMPWWFYEPDPRFPEKLNRRLWRSAL